MALSLSFPRWLPHSRGRKDWERLGLSYWLPGFTPWWMLCSVKAGTRLDGWGGLCHSLAVKPQNPLWCVWLPLPTLGGLQSGNAVWVLYFPFLRGFVQLRRKFLWPRDSSGDLLPCEGLPKPCRWTWRCLGEEERWVPWAGMNLAVGWVKTLAEFATSEVFASLGCSGSFSCSPVWVPLILLANCKQLLGTGLTEMSPQKALKM